MHSSSVILLLSGGNMFFWWMMSPVFTWWIADEEFGSETSIRLEFYSTSQREDKPFGTKVVTSGERIDNRSR